MWVNRQEKRRQKQAPGAGLQGPRGTWGLGRGWQDSERRGGRWRPERVDACPGRQAIQDRKIMRVIGYINIYVDQFQGGGSGGV